MQKVGDKINDYDKNKDRITVGYCTLQSQCFLQTWQRWAPNPRAEG